MEVSDKDDQVVPFSYKVTIKKTDKMWATRLDAYLVYGNTKLQWEQVATSAIVVIGVTFLFTIALCSALNKDDKALKQLRATYR